MTIIYKHFSKTLIYDEYMRVHKVIFGELITPLSFEQFNEYKVVLTIDPLFNIAITNPKIH